MALLHVPGSSSVSAGMMSVSIVAKCPFSAEMCRAVASVSFKTVDAKFRERSSRWGRLIQRQSLVSRAFRNTLYIFPLGETSVSGPAVQQCNCKAEGDVACGVPCDGMWEHGMRSACDQCTAECTLYPMIQVSYFVPRTSCHIHHRYSSTGM